MKIERKLSNKKMTEGKTRNVILVIAIALTTVMFTVLMTIFSSISDSQQKEEMRLNGSTSFATIKYISDDDYEILQRAFGNGNVGYRLFISSQINNESLSGPPIEMSYMDENYMLTHFCTPSVGTVPMKENEIICDSKTLEEMGVKAVNISRPGSYQYAFEIHQCMNESRLPFAMRHVTQSGASVSMTRAYACAEAHH